MDITPELVLEKVRSAGGSLSIEADAAVLADWRHAAKVAKLRLLRAGSQRLRSLSAPGKFSVWLVEVDDNGDEVRQVANLYVPPPRPRPRTEEFRGRMVPVPSTVKTPHAIVDELIEALDRPDRLIYQYRPYLMPHRQYPKQRMRRIWQAIVCEAAFRGYETFFQLARRDQYARGELVVRIDRDEFPLDLYGDRQTPLRLMIRERHPSRRRGYETWTDSPDRPLHKQLGDVFTFIEQWAELLEAQRERERQNALERRRKRDRMEAGARLQYVEQFRRDEIMNRLADVSFVADARAYVKDLLQAAARLDGGRRTEVEAWAAWIAQYADTVDPVRNAEGMPVVPEPSADDLRRFLPGGFWY